MDPITLALIALGVQVGGSLLDNIFFNLDIFGEKTAQEKQADLVKDQFALQGELVGASREQLEAERAATEISFQEQQELFAEQAETFQGSQKQAINIAGVSLTGGSPLAIQQQTIENIARDNAALVRNQEVALSQFDVAEQELITQEAGLETSYQQYLLGLEQQEIERKRRPFTTLLGGLYNSNIGTLLGGNFGSNFGGGTGKKFGTSFGTTPKTKSKKKTISPVGTPGAFAGFPGGF